MIARAALAILLGALCAGAAWQAGAQQNAPVSSFAVVDVYIDSVEPLAAWQFELGDGRGAMQVVGIEGGDNATFREPPFYDTAAVDRGAAERIIIASFSLSDPAELSSGRTRVASVHVRLRGNAEPDYELRLVAAGAADGRAIDARISFGLRTGR
jgi:hypothetical protein